MSNHVCPWWLCYTFDNPLRRLVQDPVAILRPYLAAGQTGLDLGCGMGYFSLGMARLVGPQGRVHSVDLQARMLSVLMRRATRQGLAGRMAPRQCQAHDLGIADLAGQVDLALAFWMLHEVPDQAGFLAQVALALKPSGHLLLAEPRLHVNGPDFERQLAQALGAGWRVRETPAIWGSWTALLAPPQEPHAAREAA